MNTEMREPTAAQQMAVDPKRLEHPAVEENFLGKFVLQFFVAAVGVVIGAFLALYLGLALGWVGC